MPEPQAPQALPQADPQAVAPHGLLHGAQWLAHWTGADWQHVAAGAQVVVDPHGEQVAVWHGADWMNDAVWHVPQLD